MKCLETSFLVDVLRGNQAVKQRMLELDKEPRLFATSVSAFELYYGAEISAKKEANARAVDNLLNGLALLDFNMDAAKIAGSIQASLANEGFQIGLNDVFIAATAMANNCALVTQNKKHFQRIRGLKIE